MAASIDDLLNQAMSLQENDRAVLLERLAESLDRPDAYLDEKWLAEAHRRMEAFQRGEMRALLADDVMRELDAQA